MPKAIHMLMGWNKRGPEIKALVESLPKGEPLVLRRERDNKFDPRAVQVWARGQQIGYLAARTNADVARHLDMAGEGAEMPASYAPSHAKWVEADL